MKSTSLSDIVVQCKQKMATLKHMLGFLCQNGPNGGLQLHSSFVNRSRNHSLYLYLNRRQLYCGRYVQLPPTASKASSKFRSQTIWTNGIQNCVPMQLKRMSSNSSGSIIDQKLKEAKIQDIDKEKPSDNTGQDAKAKKEMKFLGIALWKWGLVWISVCSLPVLYELYFVRGECLCLHFSSFELFSSISSTHVYNF